MTKETERNGGNKKADRRKEDRQKERMEDRKKNRTSKLRAGLVPGLHLQ